MHVQQSKASLLHPWRNRAIHVSYLPPCTSKQVCCEACLSAAVISNAAPCCSIASAQLLWFPCAHSTLAAAAHCSMPPQQSEMLAYCVRQTKSRLRHGVTAKREMVMCSATQHFPCFLNNLPSNVMLESAAKHQLVEETTVQTDQAKTCGGLANAEISVYNSMSMCGDIEMEVRRWDVAAAGPCLHN